ncbi:hypothetical protein PoB_005745400 [Plakobranchus ocellatus]|uniref:Uncharacterized protein n=1 Tax=Plakobranchus ocellatus TaxID=259542 RepID=A0AAV4CE93_9GAST|nr:hypothetical protein PoB_005745400 [Plakobranchus ocellatus]
MMPTRLDANLCFKNIIKAVHRMIEKLTLIIMNKAVGLDVIWFLFLSFTLLIFFYSTILCGVAAVDFNYEAATASIDYDGNDDDEDDGDDDEDNNDDDDDMM